MFQWLIPSSCLVLLLFPFDHRSGSPSQPSPEGQMVMLPEPSLSGLTVEQAIRGRRSIRRYGEDLLGLEQVSQLTYAAQGITGYSGARALRAAPSAGALYPIELYVAVHRVKDLPPGLYHYRPEKHAVQLVQGGDLRSELVACCWDQTFIGQANIVFIMTAVFDRTTRQYGSRGERYVHMEAGHISQNIYLQATSLGLGSVAVGAFNDEALNHLLGVEESQETSLYVHAVGVPVVLER
jgi:SagB-type dehydrogenase family enzyme